MRAFGAEGTPDERAFQRDVTSARFQSIENRWDWRLLQVDFPIVLVAVSAAPRPNSPTHVVLRCDVAGYPAQAPNTQPWDLARNQPLAAELRPKGERAGQVFKSDWPQGLYAPFDRVTLTGHPNWVVEHPRAVWTPQRDFIFFLNQIWELLNAEDYEGI